MTEERKEGLRQFLQEAITAENLEIRANSFNSFQLPPLDIERYKWHLQQSWTSYSEESLWIVSHYEPDIKQDIETKLLEFMRKELDSFIHEDKIVSAAFFVFGGNNNGADLHRFLDKLLKIALFRGVEGAVLDFERSIKETHGSFQTIALLEGITLETEIHVFEGIRLIPLPNSKSEMPLQWGNISRSNVAISFPRRTMLMIDYLISPIFLEPFVQTKTTGKSITRSLVHPGIGSSVEAETEDAWYKQKKRFHVEVTGGKSPSFNEMDFHTRFCQALSLACNSAVQIAMNWEFIAEDQFFNVGHGVGPGSASPRIHFRDFAQVGQTQIEEAKCLYEKLIDPNSNVGEKLQIPIDRWIKSKTSQTPEDKMIDLGIAFESLYVPAKVPGKRRNISANLKNNASRYLGKDKTSQETLKKKFKVIYECRCDAVHEGKLDQEAEVEGDTISMSEFIAEAQDLCRDSIMKILEDGEFPDWNNLILG